MLVLANDRREIETVINRWSKLLVENKLLDFEIVLELVEFGFIRFRVEGMAMEWDLG